LPTPEWAKGQGLALFRGWLSERGIAPVENPRAILGAAREAFPGFEAWIERARS
jgi:hypothetical protein